MNYNKETLDPSRRGWKKRTPNSLPIIHASVVPL